MAQWLNVKFLEGMLANFAGRTFYLQDQTELLQGYSLTSSSENNSKSCFIVFINMHRLI